MSGIATCIVKSTVHGNVQLNLKSISAGADIPIVGKPGTLTLRHSNTFSSQATMNVAGPSRLRPLAVPEARDRDNYEEDLTRLIAELDLADIERLQAVHETRLQRGQGLSDRELALLLLMQNAREIVQLDADLALALALGEGEDEDEEPDPAPTR
jgi:hypothetical protein